MPRRSPKSSANNSSALERVEPLIYEVRGEKVILDSDLARIYGVTTKRLNEQVKRNRERFPGDFVFQLTAKETAASRSQIATGSLQTSNPQSDVRSRSQIATLKRGQNIKYRPCAFTEHGAIMAANVLNSPRAVTDEYDVRGRRWIDGIARVGSGRAIGRTRVNVFAAIVTILQRVMDIIDPPSLPAGPDKPKIGFRP